VGRAGVGAVELDTGGGPVVGLGVWQEGSIRLPTSTLAGIHR
jgi:hypothetical protein